jgi:hypothetical protein
MIEIGEGVGAAFLCILALVLLLLVYGPSGAVTDFMLKVWRTWKGKRPTTSD